MSTEHSRDQSIFSPRWTKTELSASAARARPLRILFVTPRYYPELPGVATCVHEVARRLVRLGADVLVLATDPTGRLSPSDEIDEVRIRRVPAWPRHTDLCIAPAIRDVIRRGAWDIVHIQSYQTFVAPIAMWAAWHAGIPYVVTFHGGGHSSRLRNAIRPLQARILAPLLLRADRLIVTARFEIPLFSHLLGLPPDRFSYSPSGSDVPAMAQVRATVVDPSLVVSVGRLERYKGHHRVMEALPRMLKHRPDLRLHVLGYGPYEPNLRDLAKRLGIADRVEIRGVPPTQLQRFGECLARGAVVVSLSEYETHPVSVLNAIVLGRPVIVSDSSGLAEVAHAAGVPTIPLESGDRDVADAILAVLQHPPPPVAVTFPTWDDCAADLHEMYVTVRQSRKFH
jgi:glycogen synthase